MKSTAERLREVYCVLKSDEDAITVFSVDCAYLMHYPETWGKGDKVMVTDGMLGVWYNSTRTEIPVSHFIDLLNDSIVPWRLEEDGFFAIAGIYSITHEIDFDPRSKVISVCGVPRDNIKTYTDLLTLIRLIG